jgi:hypothetical protein
MGNLLRNNPLQRLRVALPWLGLFLVAALAIPPLLLERLPVTYVEPYSTAFIAWLSQVAVVAAMGVAIRLAIWAASDEDPSAIWVELPLIILAGLMTLWHWYHLDTPERLGGWQRETYFKIFNHTQEPPHLFRALPYGFTRTLERFTGDWTFSCLAYRWFFTWWFVWGGYRFARLWFSARLALLTLLPVAVLYPPSVWFYWGQLTDPLSHALFVFGFIWIVRDRTALLAASLALGVLAKETAVLLVPAYWACYWRGGWRPLLKATGLGVVCVTAFLAARLPYQWSLGYDKINGTPGLMILDNLGFAPPDRPHQPAAPIYQGYLQPALFVLPFVPFVVWGWQRIDGRLKVMCLILTPLVLLSNLCFGWMYESRNYMPLLPLLATATLAAIGHSNSRAFAGPSSRNR